ncbi:winged helix-turn-helix transcriptional regulator [Candidatus Pacearchaeota archaeon]|nr:winged helix-turn-helix transcriptional regulator [Candidatus Pacearchaeota archaeon]
MKTKIRKLLFEYSKNSRITTKELGRKIRASQQSASYLLNNLKKKKLIGDSVTIVDEVKLGFINVLVGFNFIKLDPSIKKEIIDELKDIDSVIGIEESKEGVDLLVEYSVKNLAAFNKIHSELIYRFDKRLKTAFAFPLITRNHYDRNYLTKSSDNRTLVLFGDRILTKLSDNEIKVLKSLVDFPNKKLVDLADSLEMSIKTLVKIKKDLEKKKVIKGYSCILDNKNLGITREIIFLRFLSEGIKEIEKFIQYTKNNKNIIESVKVIGASQIGIITESLNGKSILQEIRSTFPIESYMVIKSDKIHKKKYLPDNIDFKEI